MNNSSGFMRIAFWLMVLWGAGIVWLAPHPPMIDLPQHAGQLALLKQILSGDTRWAGLFQINPLTPYLIGFGLTLPLTFVMPIVAAMKLMLSLAYLAFVGMCILLRRHFEADARLDWLFVCSFFGFAWHWGFFTFLTAAPLGLWFILLADKQAQSGSLRQGLGLLATGLVLLVSHGLVFLFSLSLGVVMLVLRNRQSLQLLRRAWPHAGIVLGLLAYFIARGPTEAVLALPPTVPSVMWQLGLRHEVLYYAFGLSWAPPFALAALVMAAAPWLMGLRIERSRWPAIVPFGLLALGLTFVPSFMFETSFVYQRFAILLFPAYAWMFAAPSSAQALQATAWRGTAAVVLLALSCASVLGLNSIRNWNFGKESADFDLVASRIEPGQRALSLVFDRASPASGDIGTYVHYGAWYQAEHQGLIDFNFAWVPPQIVRYKLDARPPYAMGFAWRPERFDWGQHQADRYRYFLVRGEPANPSELFKGSTCAPKLAAQSGRWKAYERVPC